MVDSITSAAVANGVQHGPPEPVRKSIRVKATPERAFRIFTEEMGSWWPKTHHFGSRRWWTLWWRGERTARFTRSGRRYPVTVGVGRGLGPAAPLRVLVAGHAHLGL